ncbi:hypothetical protein WR25_15029 [Diploscapter pachys]|uniref:Uncharacterized protein n=1 Tax=Diploscapter pachys TaxID=2018661 RepID=A0A2A2LJS8_9BILA|nr:hypothetical protein WR25_15029 [Diploscapter pachys]
MAPNDISSTSFSRDFNEASADNLDLLLHEITSKEWRALFPSMMTSQKDSFKFISRCLCLTFSHIMESRRLMKQSCFKKHKLDENISAWWINNEEPLGHRLMEKLKGACDAIGRVS